MTIEGKIRKTISNIYNIYKDVYFISKQNLEKFISICTCVCVCVCLCISERWPMLSQLNRKVRRTCPYILDWIERWLFHRFESMDRSVAGFVHFLFRVSSDILYWFIFINQYTWVFFFILLIRVHDDFMI